jgi:RNA polymerase sigma-70 factor (ECF subfamily)
MEHDFETLVARLKQRDESAFNQIYAQTHRGVFSMIASIVHSREDVEDLMQETYIKMTTQIYSYQKGRNFFAWLMQIAKNTALDHYRKYHRIHIYDPQEQNQIFDQAIPSESSTIEIESILSTLSPEEKEIVLLHVVAQVKFKDIAQSVNKPLGTVLWLYQKALKKLKSTMEKGENV